MIPPPPSPLGLDRVKKNVLLFQKCCINQNLRIIVKQYNIFARNSNLYMARCLTVDTPVTLAPIHIYSRIGTILTEKTVFTPPPSNTDVYAKSIQEYHIWSLSRVVGSSGERQVVPGFGGFISATGTKPSRNSTIDYFTPINQPFKDYSVIKELLIPSEEATAEVVQEYVLNTLDLGGCMKALPLIWKFPDHYKNMLSPLGHSTQV